MSSGWSSIMTPCILPAASNMARKDGAGGRQMYNQDGNDRLLAALREAAVAMAAPEEDSVSASLPPVGADVIPFYARHGCRSSTISGHGAYNVGCISCMENAHTKTVRTQWAGVSLPNRYSVEGARRHDGQGAKVDA